MAARVKGAREVARRTVPDRAGMAIFSAPNPKALNQLRTAEDVFALAGYRAGIGNEREDLNRVRITARDAPFVAEALNAHAAVSPGARAGRRLKFRVVARLVGEHEFRRVDFQHAVERGILERSDHTWRLVPEDGDAEFWATLIEGEMFLAVRLSDERMRTREYKAVHRPASTRPAVAAALAWLSDPQNSDVILDPFCGAATILIARAHLGRYAQLIGSDRDDSAIAAAKANVGPRYQPIRIERWDASKIELPDASVDKVITNLPWGLRYGTHGDNRRLYPRWIEEFKRVLKPDGTMVFLTSEWRLMRMLESRGLIRPCQTYRVSILGTPATIYVCKK